MASVLERVPGHGERGKAPWTRCVSTKVAGERDEPTKSLPRALTKTLKGTHDSRREGHPDGNVRCGSWTTILVHL